MSVKTVGLMCVKDEADLLPQVYPHVRGLVDHVYAYDDGSQDGTWDLIKHSDYAIRRVDDKARPEMDRPQYHHLLERIKKDFKNQETWVFITMGDRFFLNKKPAQIVAEAGNFQSVGGIQLDFLRHRLDPWTEQNDTWPDMSNIRHTCRWMKYDERCVVAFKLRQDLTYVDSKYPWPRGLASTPSQYASPEGPTGRDIITKDMPFWEHQGRRSPKSVMWRFNSGSRKMSKKYSFDVSSYAGVMETMRRWYNPHRVFPWIDESSLDLLVECNNNPSFDDRAVLKYFFNGLEAGYKANPLPPRRDI